MNVRDIRPRRDWVLVLDDPRKDKTASGILLPSAETGAEKVTEGSGEVVAVGNGEKNAALGLEKGSRIVYRGFLKHAQRIPSEEKWPDGQEKIFFFLNSNDIMASIGPEVEVGVFSGRPAVPSKE